MNKKRVYTAYEVYEGDALKDYLEHMALQGWKLTRFGNFLLHFEACDPHPIRYCVEIMEKASAYASNQTLQLKRYREFCKDAGWEYIGSNGILHIFYTEDMDAIPVETDAQERYERIIRVYKANNRMTIGLFTLIILMNLYSCWTKGSLLNFHGFVCLLLIAAGSYQLLGVNIWKKKANRSLEETGTLPILDWKRTRLKNQLVLAVILLFCGGLFMMMGFNQSSKSIPFVLLYLIIYIVLLVFFSLLINWLREKKTFSKRTNMIIYWGTALLLVILMTSFLSFLIFKIIL